jgi:hypothetical protein
MEWNTGAPSLTVTSAMSLARALCLVPALLSAGCVAAATQIYAELSEDEQHVGPVAEVPAATGRDGDIATAPQPSAEARALAEALLPPVAEDSAPTPAADVPVDPAELTLEGIELEWVDHHGGYAYFGSGAEASKVLRVAARARVTATAGEKAEVVIKASCDDAGYVVTDADVSLVDDSAGARIPAPGTEFRIATKLFVSAPPTEPSKCRVTVMLRDPSRTPTRRSWPGRRS